MIVGALILPSALFTPLQVSTHSVVWFVICGIPQAVLTACAFAMVTPVLQAVCPYRLRGLGTAMGVMYVVFIGGFAGGILADFFTNAFGVRGAVLILGIPTSIIGGLLLMNGARYIRHDLSLVVEELLEEQDEQRKRAEEGARTPVLQVANIDFSYGPVQVLFDVNFEIHRGECVALLGTNGAGKSTILRVISGLEVPERGVVRLNGRNITYVAPEQRVRHGHRAAPGRQGRVPEPHRRRRTSASAPGSTAAPTTRSTQRVDDDARALPRARGAPQAAGAQPLGRPAADARARPRADARARDPADRRALARPRAGRRAAHARARRPAEGTRPDDAHRRAVAQRRARDRRPRDLPREGRGARSRARAQELLERDDLARAVFFGTEGG